MTNKYKKDTEKPYERFIYGGEKALSDAELLAIILRTGRKGADAIEVAKDVLNMSGQYGLSGLYHLTLDDLKKIKGIGEVKAIKLKCIAELSNRIVLSKRKDTIAFLKPDDFASFYMESLRHEEREKCICIFLDGSMHFIKDVTISSGCVNKSIISNREIFIEALSSKAVYIVLLHNHPSGNPFPSLSDKEVTERLNIASKLMEIPLIDHIIIGDNQYYSFKENGLIT